MPSRASNLPNIFERTVLQKLSISGDLPAARLGRASLLKKLQTKGWIECNAHQVYWITLSGKEAFRAKLPLNRGSEPTGPR